MYKRRGFPYKNLESPHKNLKLLHRSGLFASANPLLLPKGTLSPYNRSE